jgi:hypothetical protein
MSKHLLYVFGLLVGILSIPAWISDVEFMVWVAISLFTAIVVNRAEPVKSLAKSFALGSSWSVGYSLIKILFFDQFISYNPDYLKSLEGLPNSIDPIWVPLITMPILAIVLSLLLWLSMLLVSWIR